MEYRRLTKTKNDRGKLIPANANPTDWVTSDVDWYVSVFKYSQEQKDLFDKTGTIKGMEPIGGDVLYWDFDSVNDLDASKSDAEELCHRLNEYDIPFYNMEVSFSGGKGFGVRLFLNQTWNRDKVTNVCRNLADGLATFDETIYDAPRILRIAGTKHEDTGLYKRIMAFEEFQTATIGKVKELSREAYSPAFNGKKVTPPESWNDLTPVEKKVEKELTSLEIDFNNKPKGWTNCKWALCRGVEVKEHDRHYKLLCIASTCKNLGYTKTQSYYQAKAADEEGIERYGGTKSSKEDLWTLVESVYSPSWNGGTFTCKDGKTPWLTAICGGLGLDSCEKQKKTGYSEIGQVYNTFKQYAIDADKNTIKTGIKSLDESVRFRVGQMIGILGAPSAGKTALMIKILKNTSNAGIHSVCYSLDMADSEFFQKLAQHVTGLSELELYSVLKTNPVKSQEILDIVQKEFSNVKFSFQTGVSVQQISDDITDYEEQKGEKIKLLMIDYNELISGNFSDATANSGAIAGELKKLTNSLGVCTVVLLQPAKVWGDASDELNTYRATKGSSLLEQCFSVILGIFRPGFTPKNNGEDDKFMTINSLKNRMGKMFSINYYWNGARGEISEIDESGAYALAEVIEKKLEEKAKNSSSF